MKTSDPRKMLARQIAERLRQEKETFDQQQRQDQSWFCLRLAMGAVALVLLPAVFYVTSRILLYPDGYSVGVVTSAGIALFTDVLGLVISIWKIVLSPGSSTKLGPITKKISQNRAMLFTVNQPPEVRLEK